MNDKLYLEKAVKYLGRLLNVKPLKNTTEIKEVKEVREYINGMMYEKKKVRSKNANSYLWALCTEIGNALKLSKEEVYLRMLKDYGQVMMIPVEKGTTPEGFFKYYEYETSSKINGKDADWYKVYKGSSNFNNKEMSILLDGVIQECNNLEIPTISDQELERLKANWDGE